MGSTEAIEHFRQKIEGKNVVFVGAGAINKDKELGEWIDSFDTVIKTNGSLFLQEKEDFQKDFGNRIDLLYVNNQFIREMHPLDKDYIQSVGITGIAFKTPLNNRAQHYGDTFYIRSFSDSVNGVDKIMNSKGLTTGAVIQQDIINFRPRYFFATGIDFMWQKPQEYQPNSFPEYVKGYLPEKIIKQANQRETGKKFKHSRYKMALHFKHLCDNGLIDTHDEVLDIMHYILQHKNFYNV